MRLKSLLLFVVLAGSLMACAHSSIEDCYTTDWFGLGHRDGRVGAPVSVFETYLAACREAEVLPDREAYENGRRHGLELYCTEENGFRTGRAGRVYHHVCPPALERAYLAGRALGMRMQGCAAEIFVWEHHLTSLEQALNTREQALESSPTAPAAEARLRREIKEFETLLNQAVNEMEAVELRCLEML